MHKSEIDDFLMHLELPQEVKYYRPCKNIDILQRMVNNLIFAYIQKDKPEKANELKALQNVLKIKLGE